MNEKASKKKLIDFHRITDKVILLIAIFMIVLITLATVLLIQGNNTRQMLSNMQNLRIPVPIATADIISGANRVSASQRAYMMTGDEKFKAERRMVWEKQINPALEQLQKLRNFMKVEDHQTAVDEAAELVASYELLQEEIDQYFEENLKEFDLLTLILEDTALAQVTERIQRKKEFERKLNLLVAGDASRARKNIRAKLMPLNNAQEDLLRQDNVAVIQNINRANIILILVSLIANISVIILAVTLVRSLRKSIQKPTDLLKKMAQGELVESTQASSDELNEIIQASHKLSTHLKKASFFALEVGEGNFDHSFESAGENDQLGNSLLQMRSKLKEVAEEDRKSGWANSGLAELGNILRKETEQEEKLYNALVSFSVKYLNVNQGALFLLDDNQEEPVLFRAASYAYGRRKYITDSFEPGEGLVGQVFLERELIALSEMPENFVNITSGLGEAPPTFIVTCPLNYNNECYGVLELAAFRELEEYELQFIVKIGEQIGAAISKSKINSQTRRLLEEAQQQAEELRAQEEEMQQNLEELAATQEEMGRKEREYQQIIEELKQQLAS